MFFRNLIRAHASKARAGSPSAGAALAWPAACLLMLMLMLPAAGAWAQDESDPAPGDAGPGADYRFSISAGFEGEVQEGDDAEFTIRLERAPGVTQTNPVSIALSVEDGSAGGDGNAATSEEDFDASGVSETLEFRPGGALQQTIRIPITDDDYAEAAETFSVALSLPASDVNGGATVEVMQGAGSATATIAASDTMHLALTGGGEEAAVIEGENLEFTLELWGGFSREEIIVDLDTSDGSAIAKTNYVRPRRDVKVRIEDDREFVDDVLRVPVFVYTLRNPASPPLVSFRLSVLRAFPVLLDSQVPSSSFAIEIAPGQSEREGFISNQSSLVRLSLSGDAMVEGAIPESAGPVRLTLTAELSAESPPAPASGLTIPIRTYDRSRDRKDFRHTLTTWDGAECTTTARSFGLGEHHLSITIDAGARSGETEFCLLPTDNNTADRARTSLVFFTDAREEGSTPPVVATHLRIEDDEEPPDAIAWFADRDRVVEGDGDSDGVVEIEIWAEFTYEDEDNTAVFERDLTLSPEVKSALVNRPDDASDFSFEPLEVVIPAHSRSSARETLRLTLVDDEIPEEPEKLRIRHIGKRHVGCRAVRCEPNPGSYELGMTPAYITIEDDDNASGVIQLELSDSVVNEGDDATEVTVTANWIGATALPGDIQLSVMLRPYGGGLPEAVSGEDYEAVGQPLTLTISHGTSRGQVVFSFDPINDAKQERTERISVTGTVTSPAGPDAPRVRPATLIIEDNEPAGIVLRTVGVRYGDNPDNPGRRVYEGRGIARVRLRAEFTGPGPDLSALPHSERIPLKFEVIPYSRWAGTGGAGFTLTQKGPGNDCVSEEEITSITITIPAGMPYEDVWFCIKPDDDNYFQRARRVDIAAVSTYTNFPVEPALLRIREDETQPGIAFSLEPPGVPESGGPADITLTARLTGDARFSEDVGLPIRIGISTGGTTAAHDDYNVADRNLRIVIPKDGAEGSATFTFTPVSDSTPEGDETVTIGLSGSVYTHTTFLADFSRSYDDLIIWDDDLGATISASPAEVDEGPGAEAVFTVSLDGPAERDIEVAWVVDGAGLAHPVSQEDYTAPASPLTISAGDRTGTLRIPIRDDTVLEGRETLRVKLTGVGVVGGTYSGPFEESRALVAINDNERVTFSVTVPESPVPEGAGNVPIRIDMTLHDGATLGIPLRVNWTLLDGSASVTEDLLSAVSGVHNVSAGEQTGGEAISLQINDDNYVEGTEEFSVRLSLPPSDFHGRETIVISAEPALVTIEDNDAPPAEIEITLSRYAVNEGDTPHDIKVTASLSSDERDGATLDQDIEIFVALAPYGGGDLPDAIAGEDYRPMSSRLIITIPKWTSSNFETFTFRHIDDFVVERSERLAVTGTIITPEVPGVSGITVRSAPLTIEDNDSVGAIQLSVAPPSIPEDEAGVSLTSTVTVTGTFTGGITYGDEVWFTPLVTQGSRLGPLATPIRVPAGATSFDFPLPVTPPPDNDVDGDITLILSGTACIAWGCLPPQSAANISVRNAELTIEDNDMVLATVTAPEGAVSESDTEAVFTVELSRPDSLPARVRWSVSPGSSATAGEDYTLPAETTLEIAAGSTEGEIRIPLLPDPDLEGPEILGVTLESIELVGGAAGAAELGEPASAELTLSDDDQAQVIVEPASALESTGKVEITLSLDLPEGASRSQEVYFEWQTVRVLGPPNTADPGVDYEIVAPTRVRFLEGVNHQVVSVTIRDDDEIEADETFGLLLGGASPLVDLGDPYRTDIITIIDDDQVVATLAQPEDAAQESDDAAVFTVKLNRAHDTSPVRVSWSIDEAGSSATAGEDYTPPAETTLEIAAGSTKGEIGIPLSDDRKLEGPETLRITLHRVWVVGWPADTAELGAPASAELTIEDDESASVRVSSNLGGVEGGEPMRFTISLEIEADVEHPPISILWYTEDLTVNDDDDYEAAVAGEDYEAVGETELIFEQGGIPARQVYVTLLDDEVSEETERYRVRVRMRPGPLTPVIRLPQDATDDPLQGRAGIHDDDFTPPRIELDVRPTSVIEGQSQEIIVTSRYSEDPNIFLPVPLVIDLALENVSAQDEDYTASPLSTLTIGKFSTSGSASFTFTAHEDGRAEETETVRISGTLEGYEILPDTLDIVSEDEAPARINLRIVPGELHEGEEGPLSVTIDGVEETGWSPFDFIAEFEEGASTLDEFLRIPVHFFVRYWRPGVGMVSRPVKWVGDTEEERRAILDIWIFPGATSGMRGFNTKLYEDEAFEPYSEMYIRTGPSLAGYETNEGILRHVDNDPPPRGVELNFIPGLVSEDDGVAEVTLTATLLGSQLPYDARIPLDPAELDTAGVLAITPRGDAGCSLAPPASAPPLFVTIQADQWTGEAPLCIYPHDSNLVEEDRELLVGADPLPAPPGYEDYPVTSATLIIEEAYTLPEGVVFSLEPATVHEGAGPTPIAVTATLTGGGDGTFPYEVTPYITWRNGTAEDEDYSFEEFETTGSYVGISIPAGGTEGTATVTFTPEQDELLEDPETIEIGRPRVILPASAYEVLTVLTPATLTIADDDTEPTTILLTAKPTQVSEGSGAYTINLTAEFQNGGVLEDPVIVPVRVFSRYWTPFAQQGPGFTENDRYPGDPSFQVTIPAHQRTSDEVLLYTGTTNGDNRFSVREHQIRAAPDYDGEYTVLPATVRFVENDAPPSGITLELTPPGIAEGDTDATVATLTARLDGPGSHRLPYRVEIPLDFSDLGDARVEFRSRDEESGECTETPAGPDALPPTVLTIPALAFASDPVLFCVFPLDDQVARGDRELEISAEPVLAPSGAESYPPGVGPYPVTSARLAVTDDDTPPTSVVLEVQPAVLEEGAGDFVLGGIPRTNMRLTATFEGGTGALPDDFTIPLAFFERHWAPAGDVETSYEGAPPFIIIPKEQRDGERTFDWTCREDNRFVTEHEWPIRAAADYEHADEYPVTPTAIRCNDNDPPPGGITLSVSPSEVYEGDGPTEVTLTATLEGPSTLPYNDNILLLFSDAAGVAFPSEVGVPCTEASFGDEARSVFVGGAVTIRAGETSGEETFCMKPLEDHVAYGDRELVISAVDRPAPDGVAPYPVAPATLTIRENDTAPGDILVSLAPGEIDEDGGLQPVRVVAAFQDGGEAVLPEALEIPLELGGYSYDYRAYAAESVAACEAAPGSAPTAPGAPGPAPAVPGAPGPAPAGSAPAAPDAHGAPDVFDAPGASSPTPFSVVIPAQERSGDVFLCVTPADDERFGGDRLVPVSLVGAGDPGGALAGYTVPPPPELVIREDETPPGRVLLLLRRAASGAGAPGESPGAAGAGEAAGADADAETGAAERAEIPETGPSELVLTAQFPFAAGAALHADTVVYVSLTGAAKSGYGGYQVNPGAVSVTIPAGERSSDEARFTLTPEDDTVVERESIDLGGGGRATAALRWPSGDFAAPGRPDTLPVDGAGAELRIIDDDEALISLVGPAAPVDEGGTARFTVRLSGPVDGSPVVVAWFTSDGSAVAGEDYIAAPGETVELFAPPPDLAVGSFSVLTHTDELSENEEYFDVALGAVTSDDFDGRVRVADDAATAQATISANGPIMVMLEGPPPEGVPEGEDAVFRVSLLPEGILPEGPIRLDYVTRDGTAEADRDYTGAAGTLHFTAADAAPREVRVSTIENTLYDGDRDFTLYLDNVTGGSERRPLTVWPPLTEEGGGHALQAVIVDDDTPPELHLQVVPGEIAEAAAGTPRGRSTLIVELRGSAFAEARTAWFSFAGNATPDEDYSVSGDAIEIPAGALGVMPETIQVDVIDDDVDDDAEWILVSARVLEEEIEVLGEARQILIHDDDDPLVTVSFTEASLEISEGRSHEITALLDAPPKRKVRIPLSVERVGGATREDYKGVPTELVFGPEDTEQHFVLHVQRDRVDEHGAGEGVRLFIDPALLPERVLLGEPPGIAVSFIELLFGEDIQHALKYALASFGRSVAMSTLDVIEDRFEVTGDSLGASYLAVGGRRVPLGAMRRGPRERRAKGRSTPALRDVVDVLGVRFPRDAGGASFADLSQNFGAPGAFARDGRFGGATGYADSLPSTGGDPDGGLPGADGGHIGGGGAFSDMQYRRQPNRSVDTPGAWSGDRGGANFTSASQHAGANFTSVSQHGGANFTSASQHAGATGGGSGSSSSASVRNREARDIGRGGGAPDMRVRIEPPSARDLLSRSAFSLAPGAAGTVSVDSAWTIWGRSDVRSFDGNPGGRFALDATTFSTHLGVDYRRAENILTGFSLSHTVGDMSYVDASRDDSRGDFRAHLTALNHYSHWSYSDTLDLYVVMGEGFGVAEIEEYGKRAKTDINLHSSILGARRGLQALGVVELAAKADAFLVEVESDARPAIGLPKLTAHVMRMRAMLEGSAQSTTRAGARLRNTFEMGVLLDAGDADRGEGLEFGTEFYYADDISGVELSGRWMLAYTSGGYQEWGAALTLNLDPGAPGRGVRLLLAPDWGAPSGGGVDALWHGALERDAAEDGGRGNGRRGASPEQVKMELAYGMGLLQGGVGGRVEPFGTWFFEDSGAWNLRLGVRLELSRFARSETGEDSWLPSTLQMELVGEHYTARYREDDRRIGIKFGAGF